MQGKRAPLSLYEDAYLSWCVWPSVFITVDGMQRNFKVCLRYARRRHRRNGG